MGIRSDGRCGANDDGGVLVAGKRVQIYLPADLLEKWEDIPRYERSATVAAALRAFWNKEETDNALRQDSHIDSQTDQKVKNQGRGD